MIVPLHTDFPCHLGFSPRHATGLPVPYRRDPPVRFVPILSDSTPPPPSSPFLPTCPTTSRRTDFPTLLPAVPYRLSLPLAAPFPVDCPSPITTTRTDTSFHLPATSTHMTIHPRFRPNTAPTIPVQPAPDRRSDPVSNRLKTDYPAHGPSQPPRTDSPLRT